MALKQEAPLFIDLVNGRIGTFVGKEEIGNKVHIKFKPLNSFNPFSNKEMLNVPKDGIYEIPSSKLQTSYNWIVVVADGTESESVILEHLKLHYKDLIEKLDKETKFARIKSSAADAKRRATERKLDEAVERQMDRLRLKRGKPTRPRLLRESTEEYA